MTKLLRSIIVNSHFGKHQFPRNKLVAIWGEEAVQEAEGEFETFLRRNAPVPSSPWCNHIKIKIIEKYNKVIAERKEQKSPDGEQEG